MQDGKGLVPNDGNRSKRPQARFHEVGCWACHRRSHGGGERSGRLWWAGFLAEATLGEDVTDDPIPPIRNSMQEAHLSIEGAWLVVIPKGLVWENIQHGHEEPCIHSMADSGIGLAPDPPGPYPTGRLQPVLIDFLLIRAIARHLRAGIHEYNGNPRLGSGAWHVGNSNGCRHVLWLTDGETTLEAEGEEWEQE